MPNAISDSDLASFIAKYLSEQLEKEIGPDAAFGGLGLDSLDFVRLTDALADKLGVEELPVSLVLEFPTVTALAKHLSANPSG